mmetsp:Transcript_7657/g.11379  ORF Transcript_7657/g.11379 Transcript_7657/m.11379 type:complete len:113 (+) Transcript_7657:807-1145(+)
MTIVDFASSRVWLLFRLVVGGGGDSGGGSGSVGGSVGGSGSENVHVMIAQGDEFRTEAMPGFHFTKSVFYRSLSMYVCMYVCISFTRFLPCATISHPRRKIMYLQKCLCLYG